MGGEKAAMPGRIDNRTNPNWAGGPQYGTAHLQPVEPTLFESLVERFQIPKEEWPTSDIVRLWVQQHARQRYVPEWLLDAFGIVIGEIDVVLDGRANSRSCTAAGLAQLEGLR